MDLAIMAIVVFLFGAIRPLADPDLPMHLTVGEWIARHRSRPIRRALLLDRRRAAVLRLLLASAEDRTSS